MFTYSIACLYFYSIRRLELIFLEHTWHSSTYRDCSTFYLKISHLLCCMLHSLHELAPMAWLDTWATTDGVPDSLIVLYAFERVFQTDEFLPCIHKYIFSKVLQSFSHPIVCARFFIDDLGSIFQLGKSVWLLAGRVGFVFSIWNLSIL